MKALILLILALLAFCMQELNNDYISEETMQRAEKKYGGFVRNRYQAYNDLLKAAKDKKEEEKLVLVNDFFNDVGYQSDRKNWKQKDYWATPLEFLGKDKGDCEDYVIAKLFALKALGVSSDKLFMTYVKSSRFKAPHMVLTYFSSADAQPLILDNTNFKVFPASQRQDLRPIYNFNGDSLYLSRKKGKGKQVTIHPKTHQKWDTLIQRIQRNAL